MRGLKTSVALGCLTLAAAAAVQANTLTLTRGTVDPTFYPAGYNGGADNTLFYYNGATPRLWMRSSDGGYAMSKLINGSTYERSMLRFDLSGLTGKGITVTSGATITLTSYITEAPATISSGTATYNLYQIAPANAGWVESTNNTALNPSTAAVGANNGDPTWWYKSIDTVHNDDLTPPPLDTTSVTWASGHVSLGGAGSNPEGYANTGGLWNPIDLVDFNPATPVTDLAAGENPSTYYVRMDSRMDPIASAPYNGLGTTMTFTIPASMIQSWIDNPGANAGLLCRSGPSGNNKSMRVRSFEWGTVSQRPQITFDYLSAPAVAGDFNNDGFANATDIDLLFAAQQGSVPPADAKFDLNGDNTVNSIPNTANSDADRWVRTIKLTEYGDTNLDKAVNFDDLLALAQGYGLASASWSQGDIDGVEGVAFDDLLLMAQHYGFTGLGVESTVSPDQFWSDWQLAQSMVPEPTSLALLGGARLLRRRR